MKEKINQLNEIDDLIDGAMLKHLLKEYSK